MTPCARGTQTLPRCVPAALAFLATRLLQEVKRFEGHTDDVTGLALSSDGRVLCSLSDDGTARVWNVDTAVTVREFSSRGSGLVLSHDGRTLFCGSDDHTVRAWSVDTGAVRAQRCGVVGSPRGSDGRIRC